ncbi:hypothetical protein UCRPA7_5579 [Phaeoacremonium minimum UCRPA7]|uniref:Uncharacterized protein n=1 Tax=Phaeoacremonium minimum (strain UCR-PA7) TaxID=1286976 RepID=R8BHX5_PHAM7|nr:hypothetical protein UCRPA7_5579 [Phaeoacremonium minimum UCRPA7]EON98911.1 hypothetical protein UCRPA7_5579 [Phaeoacremonium minimum UCRPA7]
MSSSEESPEGLNSFESHLRELLDGLAVNHSPLSARKQTGPEKRQATSTTKGKRTLADRTDPNSFSFKFDEDVFTPNTHRFTRNSAESINTRFVDQEQANSNWQFNAGGVESDGTTRPTPPRSRSSGRLGRRSPFRTQSRQASFVDPAETDKTPTKQGSFDAEEWSQKINPEIFVPQQTQRTSVSPTRAARAATKKGRPVRQTMGTAGMVDEEESSSGPDDRTRPATAASHLAGQPQSTNSPSAMDIDSPPVQPPVKPQTNGARNIPVEPSRPDWRAGVVDGVKEDAKAPPVIPPSFAANAGGSEDSEEFRASFADFRKVEPFAEKATGLNSFGDLKSNLPFESKASSRPPLKKQKPKQTKLTLPHPPEAPRPPPTLAVPSLKTNPTAWQKYIEAFHQYMRDWHVYNTKFVEHFHAREVEIQRVKTLNDFSWLDSRDNSGIQEYLAWAEQDRQVRDQWTNACNNHEQHVREFMAHREKMKVELA